MAAKFRRSSRLVIALQLGIFVLFLSSLAAGDDVSRAAAGDERAVCSNDYRLVKIKEWVNGVEKEPIGGLTADFGSVLPSKAEEAHRLSAAFADPLNGCTLSSSNISGSIAMVVRGDCDFTTKAEVAQAGGAAGLIVINDDEGLVQMDCGNDTNINITIPVVTISKSGGEEINKSMASGAKVELLFYSPDRPILDYSVIFLWLMAVGTVVFASLWSEITESKQSDDHYNELSQQESGTTEDNDEEDKEVLHISAKSAIVFVIMASTFLLLLYFFMSSGC